MLSQLTKNQAKKLMNESERIDNLMYDESFSPQQKEYFFKQYISILRWYRAHGFSPKSTMRSQWNKLSELFGFKPSFYENWEYRTGVWGLEWDGYPFLVYYSRKGLSVEVSVDFPFTIIEAFFRMMRTQLQLKEQMKKRLLAVQASSSEELEMLGFTKDDLLLDMNVFDPELYQEVLKEL